MNANKNIQVSQYVNNFMCKIGYSVLSFGANALIARNLGPELRGEYTWILNIASIFSIVAGLGVYQSIPYFNRKKGNSYNVKQEYANSFVLQFCIYILISFLSILYSKNELLGWILLIGIFDIFSQQFNMLELIINIKKRNKIFLSSGVLFCLGSIMINMLYPNSLRITLLLFLGIKIYLAVAYFVSTGCKLSIETKVGRLMEKVKFGYLPMLSLLLITFNYKVDILMLKTSVESRSLGIYSVGVSIVELAWFVPEVFREVLFSKTAKENHISDIVSALRVSNLVMVFVIFFEILFGKLFIRTFYGNEYIEAYYVILILFLGIPAMAWFKIIYTLFNAQGKRKISFVVLVISAILNIILNYILIPIIGIYGAATSSVISYTFCGGIYIILFACEANEKVYKLLLPNMTDIKKLCHLDSSMYRQN